MSATPIPTTLPITIKVPGKFWYDHKDRGCSETAEVVKYGKTLVTVTLDEEAWRDLYSDAEYYAEQDSDVWAGDYRGLISSAKATLRRMTAVIA